jgi:hypothetical protein
VASGPVDVVSVEKKIGKYWYPTPHKLYLFSINFKNNVNLNPWDLPIKEIWTILIHNTVVVITF